MPVAKYLPSLSFAESEILKPLVRNKIHELIRLETSQTPCLNNCAQIKYSKHNMIMAAKKATYIHHYKCQ